MQTHRKLNGKHNLNFLTVQEQISSKLLEGSFTSFLQGEEVVSQTQTYGSLGNFLKILHQQEGTMGTSGDITGPL